MFAVVNNGDEVTYRFALRGRRIAKAWDGGGRGDVRARAGRCARSVSWRRALFHGLKSRGFLFFGAALYADP